MALTEYLVAVVSDKVNKKSVLRFTSAPLCFQATPQDYVGVYKLVQILCAHFFLGKWKMACFDQYKTKAKYNAFELCAWHCNLFFTITLARVDLDGP